MTHFRLAVSLLSMLAACTHLPSAELRLGSPEPQGLTRVRGVVQSAFSAEPIFGAQISVDRSSQVAFTDRSGRFAIRGLQPGSHTVHLRFIGYRPIDKDIVTPDTGTLTIDVTLRRPGDGPPVDSSLVLPIWMAVLARYRPTEAEHVRFTASVTGTPSDSSNTGRVPIVLLDTLAERSATASWLSRSLDSLVVLGFGAHVCHRASAGECPDTQFTTFIALRTPRQDFPDTVAVQLEETAINPAACRSRTGGPMFGGFHTPTLYLAIVDGEWRVVGTRFAMSGTLVCGAH